jgi:murein DD-endopeptidase MepM/ murein hydrolase activator NlpD
MRVRLLLAAGVMLAASVFALRNEWARGRPVADAPLGARADTAGSLSNSPPSIAERPDTLQRGETLSALFARNGLNDSVVRRVASLLDLRRLQAGLVFRFRRPAGDSLPDQVTVRTGPEQRVLLTRLAGSWDARTQDIAWTVDTIRVSGSIETSLYDALDAAIPVDVLADGERVRLAWDVADVYQWQVDFSRDLQPGDDFLVLLERLLSEEGEVRVGRILAAELEHDGRPLTAFRFGAPPGASTFYDQEGRSLRRAFLKSPVEFRRISSRFNRSRRHPVLGYARRHEGTDYAADPGTPVLAAGDGQVIRAAWSGGYGNLVEVRHRNGIVTRYGHLRSYASGVRAGARVTQGQVIAYVGSTGLSNGPHLHYEFRVNGVARDPMKVDPAAGEPLTASARPAFQVERDRLRLLLDGVTPAPLAAVEVRGAATN